MLEGKDYHTIDMDFPFMAAFIDGTASFTRHLQLTSVHTAYSDIINELFFSGDGSLPTEQSLHGVATRISAIKQKADVLIAPIKEINLFILKFHMLDHVGADLYRFGNFFVLNASSFGRFNYTIKQFVRRTSKWKATTIEETIAIIIRSQHVEDEGVASKERVRNNCFCKQRDNWQVRNWKEAPCSLLVRVSQDEKRAFETNLLAFSKAGDVIYGNSFLDTDVTLRFVKCSIIWGGAVLSLHNVTDGKVL